MHWPDVGRTNQNGDGIAPFLVWRGSNDPEADVASATGAYTVYVLTLYFVPDQ